MQRLDSRDVVELQILEDEDAAAQTTIARDDPR